MRRFEFKILTFYYDISFYGTGWYASKEAISRLEYNFIDLMSLIANYTKIIFKLRNGKYIYIKRNEKYEIYRNWIECFKDIAIECNNEDDFWKSNENNISNNGFTSTQMIISFKNLKKYKCKTRKYHIDKNIFGLKKYHVELVNIIICEKKLIDNTKDMRHTICRMLWK